jgi:hypothetical protein
MVWGWRSLYSFFELMNTFEQLVHQELMVLGEYPQAMTIARRRAANKFWAGTDIGQPLPLLRERGMVKSKANHAQQYSLPLN